MTHVMVKVLKSPVTSRYVVAGDIGLLDKEKNQVRINGAWFNFDDRWKTEEVATYINYISKV